MFNGHWGVHKQDGSTPDSWHQYTCGFCGSKVSGAVVASQTFTTEGPGTPSGNRTHTVKWLQCTHCAFGSVWNDATIHPGVPFGPDLNGLPDDVSKAYQEARRCMGVNAYTAAELICRKILMHVAVEKAAKIGENFGSYISYLEQNGYVTPPMKPWVELIREHGNQSTHELDTPNEQRAQSTVMFTAELLRLIYEMEHLASKFASTAPATS